MSISDGFALYDRNFVHAAHEGQDFTRQPAVERLLLCRSAVTMYILYMAGWGKDDGTTTSYIIRLLASSCVL